MIDLIEDTRAKQIADSRNKGPYKDQSRGRNRFERKKYSKTENQVKSYNRIDMNKFFKKNELVVDIPVVGETEDYTVTVKVDGVVTEMAKNIKNNHNQFEYRTVLQAFMKCFNTNDVWTKCTCPDYKYRFKAWNIRKGVSVEGTDEDPGLGKRIANPNDEDGRGCKHILMVLSNLQWVKNVVSVINNYVRYAETHMRRAFLTVIFPKLYGIPISAAGESNLIPENKDNSKFLDSSQSLIDVINDWGKNRGKFRQGEKGNQANSNSMLNQKSRAMDIKPVKPISQMKFSKKDMASPQK